MMNINYPSEAMKQKADDRILPITRVVALAVVPILVLAFIILYFYPDETGTRFAWHVVPHLQAMYVGAGYLGGSWVFLRTVFERRWHRVAAGFLPVTTFTVSMLLLTILHWNFFDHQLFPFQLWLFLYIVTPVLIPWLWLRNRHTDPGSPESGDLIVPRLGRWIMSGLGIVLLVFALVGFLFPAALIRIWPWALAPLSARAMAGWLSLLGVGGLVIGRELRWSSWRIGMESILIWHILVLIAAALNPGDFKGGNLLNWYIVSVLLGVVCLILFYFWMEVRRRPGAASNRNQLDLQPRKEIEHGQSYGGRQ